MLLAAAGLAFALSPACDCAADFPPAVPDAHACCTGPGIGALSTCCSPPSSDRPAATVAAPSAVPLPGASGAVLPDGPALPPGDAGVIATPPARRVLRI